jgi:hypothetical protein
VITDARGAEHSVSITTAYHDYWTAAGELRADCICGWWDHHTYLPRGQEYARLRLQYRAVDHVPGGSG